MAARPIITKHPLETVKIPHLNLLKPSKNSKTHKTLEKLKNPQRTIETKLKLH
jgi:hypothetical protein